MKFPKNAIAASALIHAAETVAFMYVGCMIAVYGILQPSLCSIEQSLRLAWFNGGIRLISPEVSDLPEPVGTNRLPSVGLVAFGQRLHLRQSGLPVAMTGRKDEGGLFTCPAENTPRQAGEPHDVVTVP